LSGFHQLFLSCSQFFYRTLVIKRPDYNNDSGFRMGCKEA
jgi:hypothetical protein